MTTMGLGLRLIQFDVTLPNILIKTTTYKEKYLPGRAAANGRL